MSFSVIIPSRNPENLRACVAAIRAADQPERIIVVWDGEGNARSVHCGSQALPAVVSGSVVGAIKGKKPFCFARNVNLGIKAAGSDDVILLNDDALLIPYHGFSDLERCSQIMQQPGNGLLYQFGVISARVKGLANPVHSADRVELADVLQDVTPAKAVPFVCVYIPRRVIDYVGLLDERFTGECGGAEVYGGEDDDYCYRVREMGFRIGVYNGCVVDHGALTSTFRPDGKGRSIAGARARFFEIHGFAMGSK